MVYIQDCILLIFPGMGTLKYPRQSLVIFSFSFMVMCILSKVRKSESDCFSVQNVKILSSVYDLPRIELTKEKRYLRYLPLFNIILLIAELDQARTLKDRIIAALKVSLYI